MSVFEEVDPKQSVNDREESIPVLAQTRHRQQECFVERGQPEVDLL